MKEIQALWENFKALFSNHTAALPHETALQDVVEAMKNRLGEIDKVLALNHFILPVKLDGSTVAQPVTEDPASAPSEQVATGDKDKSAQ